MRACKGAHTCKDIAAELNSYPLFIIKGGKRGDYLNKNQYLGKENNALGRSFYKQVQGRIN